MYYIYAQRPTHIFTPAGLCHSTLYTLSQFTLWNIQSYNEHTITTIRVLSSRIQVHLTNCNNICFFKIYFVFRKTPNIHFKPSLWSNIYDVMSILIWANSSTFTLTFDCHLVICKKISGLCPHVWNVHMCRELQCLFVTNALCYYDYGESAKLHPVSIRLRFLCWACIQIIKIDHQNRKKRDNCKFALPLQP